MGSATSIPASGQSILYGQKEVASIVNALMQSNSWASSVFFLSYDEPGGPFDHRASRSAIPNDILTFLGTIPDISTIGGERGQL